MPPSGALPRLFEHLPVLRGRLGWVPLGDWPTPLTPLRIFGRQLWVKREDLSASVYGGNKVRPLEIALGEALRRGRRRVIATGAYGSNHALATALLAPTVGLEAGALLYPQPPSPGAQANLRRTLSSGAYLRFLPTVACLPTAMAWQRLAHRDDLVMPPGAAAPADALGHTSAVIELFEQLAAQGAPPPRAIVVPCGSACTTAGLLVGLALARALGLGPASAPETEVLAVRVVPWPLTAATRISRMAVQAARLLLHLGGPDLKLTSRNVSRRLRVVGGYLGRGYGYPTRAGREAIETLAPRGVSLDTTYSAKAAAYLLDDLLRLPEPLVFWSTKSSAPLPEPDPRDEARAPARLRRWLSATPRPV